MPGKPVDEKDDDCERFIRIETGIADHHMLLMGALQRCLDTPHGRLMVFMPPGSAKSTYASVVFPTFAMGRTPGFKVIGASYGSDLARKLGRRCRSIVRQGAYTSLFDAGLSSESAAADEWALTNGSEYMAGGIRSGITGNRANLVVVDDPVKGREQAESATIRKGTIEAYQDDLETRLIPGGRIALIQTRWHEEDLAGSILPLDYAGQSGMIACRDGQTWEVICLPAKAERSDDPLGRKPGEYLWPEWFGPKHWEQFEKRPRTWASLYQQRPAPEEGDLFRADWLHPYERAPDRSTLTIYGASDYALAQPEETFALSSSYAVMEAAVRFAGLTEEQVGWSILILALIRLAVLGYNGLWSSSPIARRWMALAYTLLWSAIFVGFWSANGFASAGTGFVLTLLIGEMVNTIRTSGEVGRLPTVQAGKSVHVTDPRH